MTAEPQTNLQFEALLDYLRLSRGFDFTGYKRTSLERRVNKRLYALSLGSHGEYQDYLQVHPDEFENLFNAILINVTSFFRDPPAWEYLQSVVLPRILSNRDERDPIRVWSAGCASGEEAYSLAMILADQLGVEAFHQRVKIYATDMDNNALVEARQAIYSLEDVRAVPEDFRQKYFTPASSGNYLFNSDLRRAVIFGEHDLVQDAPISRLDLLVCRNTLMYFNSETQGRILNRFHFALNEDAVLFLGKAEMLLTHTDLFFPLELKYRFFTRASGENSRNHLLGLGQTSDEQVSNRLGKLIRIRDVAFEASPEAQLIVDNNDVLVAINEKARAVFGLSQKDVGSLLHDMEIFYQPVGLRPLIDRVTGESKPLMLPAVQMSTHAGESRYMEVHIIPLKDGSSQTVGINILYSDISHRKQLEEQLKQSTTELKTTNEDLQATNEEMQSTVEELETTNEELQSTNEELETMNEELQSTNEELETINDELTQRTTELNQSKSFLETILGNLRVGVVVVDRDFRIQNWNTQAEDMWGLRTAEVMGETLLGLDIGLPVEYLKQPIRSVLDGKSEVQDIVIQATTRRGKPMMCRVTFTPFTGGTKERRGVVLMMEEAPHEKQSS